MSTPPVALVTGAGSGIGKACALALLQEGYQVVLAGRRRATLDEVASVADHQRTLVIPTDVSQAAEVEALFSRIKEHCGRLDLLFNNAGINTAAVPFEELRLEDWQKVIDINLTGSFLCAQKAFKLMKSQQPQGGRIINNGSISAHAPRPEAAAYTASKHAVSGLTKSLALEGRRYNIACGQLDIGNAETDMASRMKTGVLQADGSTKAEAMMGVNAVAEALLTMARMPLEANVLFMTVMATSMPFVGRG